METKSCITCGAKASLLCSGCKNVQYCSKEDQKSHWKNHKLRCSPFKLKWDVQVGEHLEHEGISSKVSHYVKSLLLIHNF